MSTVNLKGLGFRFIEKHGIDKAVEVIGRNKAVVQRWAGGSNEPNVQDLQLLVDFDPSLLDIQSPEQAVPVGDEEQQCEQPPLAYQWPEGKFMAILMPTNNPPELPVTKSLLKLFERDKMDFLEESSTLPVYSRNRLAARFLAGPWTWAYHWDSDVVLPCGDVDWFRHVSENPSFPQKFAAMNPLAQLLSRGKTIIGGCYFSRRAPGKAQFQTAHANPLIDRMAHSGPRNEIEKTPWVAAGAMLVHRSVFEDIIKTQGDQIRVKNPEVRKAMGYEYRFFTPSYDHEEMADNSEDVAFCVRAKQAGHDVYVDHSIYPAHIGKRAYSYHNTGTKLPLYFQ